MVTHVCLRCFTSSLQSTRVPSSLVTRLSGFLSLRGEIPSHITKIIPHRFSGTQLCHPVGNVYIALE